MVLRQLRKRAGLTQHALALRAKVDHSFISLIEAGKRDLRQVGYETVLRLAHALGVSPETLVTGSGPPRSRRQRETAA